MSEVNGSNVPAEVKPNEDHEIMSDGTPGASTDVMSDEDDLDRGK